ncbi:MAG TPA: chorismate-binding protein [Smithella sp.]|nr:chorismate-binding protein [Smithella sp.]
MNILFEYGKQSLYFSEPLDVIHGQTFDQVKGCFEKIEQHLSRGCYVAGWFSYELGYALEKKLSYVETDEFPLIHAGVYKKANRLKKTPGADDGVIRINNLRFNIPKEQYVESIDMIRSYVSAGDVYQITYCLKLLFDFEGGAYSLYKKLYRVQPVPYAAFLKTPSHFIISLSPELFLYKKDNFIVSKPMKGTWPRGGDPLRDFIARQQFIHDEKNRAENIMITDLLRNDLGRIGRNVRVLRLCEVTPYKTLFQMTSTIAADLDRDISLYRLFKSLFPSGSVTGAPKIRAMEIIHELEHEPRRIYTGAIGYITPKKDLFFNIPIRTALIDRTTAQGEMGIGGGIVWDSTAEGEWAEGVLKAKFFTDIV